MSTTSSADAAPTDARNTKYAKVSVITRTKDRPTLLRRAAKSVAQQSYDDFCWVVVNDGGDEDEVAAILRDSGVPQDRIVFISHEASAGMEAASNAGIRAVDSEYIVIHDDDDSWSPDFLSATVAFLEKDENSRFDGVVTHSIYVSELIRENEVVQLSEHPYQVSLTAIDLGSIIERNAFPPISFLFRREVYNRIGGFDASLPVLGDWLFNMEFLLHANVGVLPKPLAYYHHRDRPDTTAPEYRNTVVDQLSLHEQYQPIVRNIFFRKHLNDAALSLRLALRGEASTPASLGQSAPSQPGHVSPVFAARRGENDLSWTISAVNAALASRSPLAMMRNRKLSAAPPNATWTTVVPLVQRLGAAIPPPPDFDEAAYLRQNPDVAAEVSQGRQKSGFTHYIVHGRHEGRPRPSGEHHGATAHVTSQAPAAAAPAGPARPVIDSPLMLRSSHSADGFEKVLHVAHHEWHGIRQAAAYSPGHKLLIPSSGPIQANEKESLAKAIGQLGITRICFHGYSDNADGLLLYLRSVLGPSVKFFVVSHVTTAQFDNGYEMTMLSRLLNRLSFGVLDGIGSVKPNFSEALQGVWKHTIINYAPNIKISPGQRSSRVEVYAPLDIGWRKNLFTNVVACSLASTVDVVKTANFPTGLENIHDLSKLRLVGYLRGNDLLQEMARSSLTLIATLAECQPMTQLESFAVGTPALTGPLGLQEFTGDPLIELCTTYNLDNPALLSRDIDRVVSALKSDPAAMDQMINAHLARRHALATERYAEFLEL